MSKKQPIFFDGDTGAIGSFIEIEPGTKQNTFHIVFVPLNSIKKCRIKDVLVKPEIILPPDSTIPGVEKSGYVILPKGSGGESRLFDKAEMWLGKNIKEITRKYNVSELQKSVIKHNLMEESAGTGSKLAEIAEAKKAIEGGHTIKPKKQPWEEDEYGDY